MCPSLLTCKPINREECIGNPLATEAYWKEWNNLEAKEVFRYETLSEWSEITSRARGNGEEIHFGFLFGLMVEKKGRLPRLR